MANDGYQTRQNLLHDHMMHIEDLGKDNKALSNQLEKAESEIRKLYSKVKRLEGEVGELMLKLDGYRPAPAKTSALPIRITRNRLLKPH
jgi:predicted nuclease with TOPRIM domain